MIAEPAPAGHGHPPPRYERADIRESVPAAVNAPPDRKPPLTLCILVLGGVVVLCLVSAIRGHDRFGQYTYYIYDNGDPGHPGLVNVVATVALFIISAISAFLAATLRRSPWLVNSVLFLIIGVDYLVRAHNHFPGGDSLARIAYLVVVAHVLRRLWRAPASGTTLSMVVAGFGFFLLSDIFDFLSKNQYGRGSALEESTGCLGGWCFALAIFGFAQTWLRAADSPEPPLSAAQG
jgi:hypothetical protein